MVGYYAICVYMQSCYDQEFEILGTLPELGLPNTILGVCIGLISAHIEHFMIDRPPRSGRTAAPESPRAAAQVPVISG